MDSQRSNVLNAKECHRLYTAAYADQNANVYVLIVDASYAGCAYAYACKLYHHVCYDVYVPSHACVSRYACVWYSMTHYPFIYYIDFLNQIINFAKN